MIYFTTSDLALNTFKSHNDKIELVKEPSNNTIQYDSSVSISLPVEITANQSDFDLKQLYNNKFTNSKCYIIYKYICINYVVVMVKLVTYFGK